MKKKKDLLNSNPKEIVAHIRNKLQTAETFIGMHLQGKAVSRKFCDRARKDLAEVTKLLNRLEKMQPDRSGQTKPNLDEAFKHVERACKKKFKD